MYIHKNKAIRQDWDNVKSWNYKLTHLDPKISVVYAEVVGEHGEVTTKELEWVYYIISGSGEFIIDGKKQSVSTGDVITVPAHTKYNYFGSAVDPLKVIMFIDLWDN